VNDEAVWVEQGPYMATSFHPELTADFPSPQHRRFAEIIAREKSLKKSAPGASVFEIRE
jgi:glutamine amidotransferase PdxT